MTVDGCDSGGVELEVTAGVEVVSVVADCVAGVVNADMGPGDGGSSCDDMNL